MLVFHTLHLVPPLAATTTITATHPATVIPRELDQTAGNSKTKEEASNSTSTAGVADAIAPTIPAVAVTSPKRTVPAIRMQPVVIPWAAVPSTLRDATSIRKSSVLMASDGVGVVR